MFDLKEYHGNIKAEYLILQEYFPICEIFPLENIEKAYKHSHYVIYHLYKVNEKVGFAHLVKSEKTITLSYLAIKSKYQNQGFGSYLINELKKRFSNYDNMLIEVEKEDPNNKMTFSRIRFYERLGYSKIEKIKYEINGHDNKYIECYLYITNLNDQKKQYTYNEIKKIIENYYIVLFGSSYRKEFRLEKKNEANEI